MTSCRLCGFQGPLDPCTVACPVCGEAYEKISGYQVRAVDGTLFALSRGRTWCGDASPQQQRSQLGAQALTSGDGVGLLRGSYLNPELLALLQLVPEQQSRRKRAKEDAVRAAGSLTPARREDEGQTDLDVVYIRPRNDPTMQVLKVQNTPCCSNDERCLAVFHHWPQSLLPSHNAYVNICMCIIFATNRCADDAGAII